MNKNYKKLLDAQANLLELRDTYEYERRMTTFPSRRMELDDFLERLEDTLDGVRSLVRRSDIFEYHS